MKKVLYSFAGLVALLAGCAGEEDNLPSRVQCQLELKSNTALDGKLSIENVWLNLSDLEIEGRRLNGQDVFLYRTFDDQNGNIELTNSFNNQPIDLDIPQGIYSLLNFDLRFKENPNPLKMRKADDDDDDDDDEDEDEMVPDIADYLDNAIPGILMLGKFNTPDGEMWNVVLALDDLISQRLSGRQNSNREIVLDKNKVYNAVITFDPDYWFGLITSESLESAENFNWSGVKTILIHKDFNTSLYAAIAGRIEPSTELTFDE